MITAGCDVGSLSAKAVILKDGKMIASHVLYAGADPADSARRVMDAALEKAGLALADIERCVGAGYGRHSISFADAVESEIACHARGAQWLLPDVRMIIDIGGQDAKAMRVDGRANITRYVYNDKCASGTGRFLEVMAAAMGVSLEVFGELSFQAKKPVSISNQCVVFAETEIISLMNDGVELPDIIAGLHRAMAHRVASLARAIELEPPIVMTGGVAKNRGMFVALSEALGTELRDLNADPQIIGALGAAVMAADMR